MGTVSSTRRRYQRHRPLIKPLAAAGLLEAETGHYLVPFEGLNVVSLGLFVDLHRGV